MVTVKVVCVADVVVVVDDVVVVIVEVVLVGSYTPLTHLGLM